jgi:hypothetical protein
MLGRCGEGIGDGRGSVGGGGWSGGGVARAHQFKIRKISLVIVFWKLDVTVIGFVIAAQHGHCTHERTY